MIRLYDLSSIAAGLITSLILHNSYLLFCVISQQFFLGDYRPLIQDTQGNVLDQVS